ARSDGALPNVRGRAGSDAHALPAMRHRVGWRLPPEQVRPPQPRAAAVRRRVHQEPRRDSRRGEGARYLLSHRAQPVGRRDPRHGLRRRRRSAGRARDRYCRLGPGPAPPRAGPPSIGRDLRGPGAGTAAWLRQPGRRRCRWWSRRRTSGRGL
ncbi:MAG: hypothetical protein AVDCRST_MAG77-5670, partial [uncultured Chloroflexi bacterium]